MRTLHRLTATGVVAVTCIAVVTVQARAADGSFVGPDASTLSSCQPFDPSTLEPLTSGLTPDQWHAVVGLPIVPKGTPAPQRLVLAEQDQFAGAADVANLLADCGLPAAPFTQVGSASNPEGGEATLDASIAAATLPPNTELVVASTGASGWLGLVKVAAEACGIDTSGPVLRKRGPTESPSWPRGGCIISASYGTFEDSLFPSPDRDTVDVDALLTALQEMGVIVVFSAGDESSGGCSSSSSVDPESIGLTPRFPSSHPGVLAVGGTQWDDQVTSMKHGRNVAYVPGDTYSYYVWKDSNDSAKCQNVPDGNGGTTGSSGGGGGQSIAFGMPAYQVDAASQNYPQNTRMRMTPDVSALAAWPMYALQQGGDWILNGGTSAAAPSVAVGIANVNAALSARGLPVITNGDGPMGIHSIIYNPRFAAALTDVTQGDNDLFGFDGSTVVPGYDPSLPAWQALPGFDMASGMGVLNFTTLFDMLVARATATPDPTSAPAVEPEPAAAIELSALSPVVVVEPSTRSLGRGVSLGIDVPATSVQRVSVRTRIAPKAAPRTTVASGPWVGADLRVPATRTYLVRIKVDAHWRAIGRLRSDAEGTLNVGALRFDLPGSYRVSAVTARGTAYRAVLVAR